MSDIPVRLRPSDRDPDDDGDREPGAPSATGRRTRSASAASRACPAAGCPGMPGGPGGFDVSQLGQMLTQLGQMLSQAQSTGGGPVNYDLAAQLARQRLAATTSSLTDAQRAAVQRRGQARRAVARPGHRRSRPAPPRPKAWSASEWVDASLPTWKRLCDPVAQRVSGGVGRGDARGGPRRRPGRCWRCSARWAGSRSAASSGSGLAQLAAEVLTSTDIGMPVGPDRVAALLPENIEKFTTDLDRPASEVMIYLAAREAAHHRLFAHVAVAAGAAARHGRGVRARHPRRHLADRGAGPRHRPVEPGARSRRPCGRACSSRETTPGAAGGAGPAGDAARADRGLGGRGRRRRGGRAAARAPRRCARRCAAAARPAGRPSRRSPRSSGWSCGRAGCARPPSCGGCSASSAASPGATRCGRTPT